MRNFTLFILTVFLSLPAWGQRQCGTEIAVQEQIRENPSLQVLRDKIEARNRSKITTLKTTRAEAKTSATYNTVTIPVVVHIVLQNPNAVTDAQVQSQIDVLNKDYAALNTDTSILPAVWKALIGNAKIQFCLAQRTPAGEVTNGIERVTTTKSSFSISSAAKAVKFTSTGGAAQWDGDSYLNIWVTHLESGYLGVATFPGLYADNQQGVVIDYTGFGTTGTAASPYNKGRTVTTSTSATSGAMKMPVPRTTVSMIRLNRQKLLMAVPHGHRLTSVRPLTRGICSRTTWTTPTMPAWYSSPPNR